MFLTHVLVIGRLNPVDSQWLSEQGNVRIIIISCTFHVLPFKY
jgi:hypothetical protein